MYLKYVKYPFLQLIYFLELNFKITLIPTIINHFREQYIAFIWNFSKTVSIACRGKVFHGILLINMYMCSGLFLKNKKFKSIKASGIVCE